MSKIEKTLDTQKLSFFFLLIFLFIFFGHFIFEKKKKKKSFSMCSAAVWCLLPAVQWTHRSKEEVKKSEIERRGRGENKAICFQRFSFEKEWRHVPIELYVGGSNQSA
jgi:hypothetical protein